jgi:hypothetical protein
MDLVGWQIIESLAADCAGIVLDLGLLGIRLGHSKIRALLLYIHIILNADLL